MLLLSIFIRPYTQFSAMHILKRKKRFISWRNEASKCRKSRCERDLWFQDRTILFSEQDKSVFRGRHTSSYGSLLRTAETPFLDIIHTVNRSLGKKKRKGHPPRGLRIECDHYRDPLLFFMPHRPHTSWTGFWRRI